MHSILHVIYYLLAINKANLDHQRECRINRALAAFTDFPSRHAFPFANTRFSTFYRTTNAAAAKWDKWALSLTQTYTTILWLNSIYSANVNTLWTIIFLCRFEYSFIIQQNIALNTTKQAILNLVCMIVAFIINAALMPYPLCIRAIKYPLLPVCNGMSFIENSFAKILIAIFKRVPPVS